MNPSDSDETSQETPDQIIARVGGVLQDDGSVVLKLKRPVKQGDKDAVVDQLVIREPTAADLEEMDKAKGNVGGALRLLASLSGVSISVIRRLSAIDVKRGSEVFGALLGEAPRTGGTSSGT